MQIDAQKQPPFFKVSNTHYAATWLLHPDAPQIEPPAEIIRRAKIWREIQEQEEVAKNRRAEAMKHADVE